MSSECFDALRLLYSTDSSFTAEEREPYMKRCQQPRVQNPETKEKLQTQDFLNTAGRGEEWVRNPSRPTDPTAGANAAWV